MYAKRNRSRKLIILFVLLALIIGGTIGGTLAWLMAETDPLVNTFTVGDITLSLSEPNFPESKTMKFLPGQSFTKDPTVTVTAGSVPCYVRAFMVIWWDESADPLFDAEDSDSWFGLPNDYKWTVSGLYDNTGDTDNDGKGEVLGIVMEYRYPEIVDASNANQVLQPLFSSINVPGHLSTEQYRSLNNFKLTILAQAVQSDGFSDVKDSDGNVTQSAADVAFAAAGIPDVALTDCGNQKLATIISNLSNQSTGNGSGSGNS